ncbi:condensation domain-containing protein, partial [Methylobacterium aquaticum]
PSEDWRDQPLPEPDLDARLDARAAAERERGLPLDRAPLQRLLLVRLPDAPDGTARHRLVWTHHHILLDGWSAARFLAEVMAQYRGTPLPASTARYRDYVAWMAARQDDPHAEAFWRAALAGLDDPTRLADAFAGAGAGEPRMVALELPADRARAFAQAEGVTLNTLVQGAVALLLARLTGRSRVCFGATVAGRPAELPGAETSVGLFISTLPVVVAPDPDQAAGPWLRAVQEHNLALREHGHLPLAQLQRLAGRAGEALFDTLLVFENYPVEAALRDGPQDGDGPRFGPVSGVERANYPLMVTAAAGAGLRLQLHGHGPLAAAGRLEQVGALLAGLLDGLCGSGDRPLGRIATPLPAPALSAPAPMAGTETVTGAFARQVRERPDAEALRWGDTRLSYADLDARATHLARH